MTDPYFLAFELVVLILTILGFRHAWRAGRHVAVQLLAGMLFGLILEWATIQQLHSYAYGRFSVMLGEIPLVVGVSWGLILYSARLFSDAADLPEWARPVMDGLLALNIDLAMDAIAIRLGMWDWGQGLAFEYFGVPWANFWAWFWVVFFFSAGLRLSSRWKSALGRWLGPLLAVLVGILGVLGSNALIVFVLLPIGWYRPAIALVLGGALLLVLALRPQLYQRPVPTLALWVPLTFHLCFMLAGILSGAIVDPPFLLFVSILMGLVALILHRPILRELLQHGSRL